MKPEQSILIVGSTQGGYLDNPAEQAAIDKTMELVTQVVHSTEFLTDAPFSQVSLGFVFGSENADIPKYEGIDGQRGALLVEIELDLYELRDASEEELTRFFSAASLKALVHLGEKYDLPIEEINDELAEIEAVIEEKGFWNVDIEMSQPISQSAVIIEEDAPETASTQLAYPDLTDYQVSGNWAVAEGRRDGKPVVTRIRNQLSPLVGHPDLPYRLCIEWKYEVLDSLGLPSELTLQQMSVCEDSLLQVFEPDNLAILAYICTFDGYRRWVFYTSSIEECANRLNSALPHDPPLPIDLSYEPDECWAEYTYTCSINGL